MARKDGYIFEFRIIGGLVKVSAMDPLTLTEVSISLPMGYSQSFMMSQATKRLNYRLERLKEEHEVAGEKHSSHDEGFDVNL